MLTQKSRRSERQVYGYDFQKDTSISRSILPLFEELILGQYTAAEFSNYGYKFQTANFMSDRIVGRITRIILLEDTDIITMQTKSGTL